MNKTNEKECMIASLHTAMDEIEHAYNAEPDEQTREHYEECLYYLSKIETLINNLNYEQTN